MPENPIVFVVDDDDAVRNSVHLLLKSAGLRCKSYSSASEFLNDYTPPQSGCLLLDIRMPGLSGLALQEQLVNQGVDLPIIFITGHGDISTSVRAMKMHAFDFFEKPFNDQDLLDRINEATAWHEKIRRERTELSEIAERAATLTPREHEILQKIVEGHSNKAIARELKISPKTVEFHRKRVMEKMNADSLAALVRMTLRISPSQP